MDERRPSLTVDDGVGVAAPARWRMGWRTEEAGRSAEVVMPPTVYEWGNGGRDTCLSDELESNVSCLPCLAPTVSEWAQRRSCHV